MKKRYIVCLLILGLAMQYVGVGQMIGLIGFALFFCSFWFLIIAIGIERRKSETLGAKYEKAVSEKKKMSETPVSKDTKPTVTSETLGAKYEKAISEKKKMSEMPVNKGAKPAVTTESPAKPLTGIDRSKISYEFRQSHKEREKWSANHDERYPLIAISEFLFSKGFEFVEGYVGGGVDEISHTGAVAYRAKYTEFEAFRDNFHEDIYRAYDEAEKRYGEWFSYLDYSYISVHLAMDQLSVRVVIDDTRVRINWSNLKEEHAQLLDDVNKRMRDILIGNVVFTTERYYK